MQLHAAGFSPLFLALTSRALAISAALPIRQNAVSQRLSLLTLPSPSVRWTGTWLPTAQFIVGLGTISPDVATPPSATSGPFLPPLGAMHLVHRTLFALHASTPQIGQRRPLGTPGSRGYGGGSRVLPRWARELVMGGFEG